MARLRPRAVLTVRDLPQTAAATAHDGQIVLDEPGRPQAETDPGESNYLGRLTAYIPAEIIATYHTSQGFAVSSGGGNGDGNAMSDGAVGQSVGASDGLMLVVGLLLLAITPFWIAYTTANRSEPVAWHQVINATIGFAIWLLVTGNPVVNRLFGDGWNAVYGSAAMVVAVIFLFPIVEFAIKRTMSASANPHNL